MPSPAPLRLFVSRAERPALAAPAVDARLAPPPAGGPDKAVTAAACASFAVHAAVLVWMAVNGVFGEERSAGAANDLVLIEGIAVELVEAAPMPEAPPTEAAPETEAPPEAIDTPPEPVEEAVEPPPEPPPPEPPPTDPVAEPVPEPDPPPAPDSLPPPEAETGELPARPESAPAATAETEPPPPDPADAPIEDEPPPADVPKPRLKPERTEVAEAEPPREPAPAPAKPAAPPPSAPSAAQSAARSGGAGGGGASQTAGNAAASAYRAKVAAQLKRKRFYPSAARRDRLTGTATVSFSLNGAGKVTAAHVVRSSGERILDEAAVEMVRRASPYPPIPPGLGATITVQAPIGFELPQ